MSVRVPLTEVLQRIERPVAPIPGDSYRQVGVHWWGMGPYEREAVDGSDVRARALFRLEHGDVVINKIWARHGAVGAVPPKLDGAYVSGEFPTFTCDGERLLPEWIGWIARAAWFWAACDAQARGTSGKNRVTPERFLQVRVPLPPVDLQRRWVAALDRASSSADRIALAASAGADALEGYVAAKELEIWPEDALKGAAALVSVTKHLARGRHSSQGPSDHVLIKTQHVQMGRYVPSHVTLDSATASKVSTTALAQPGDVLIACSAAGCLGRVAQFSEAGVTASTDTHIAIARADESQVSPDYLYAYLIGAQGQFQLRSRERGDWAREKVGFRLTELNLRDLEQVPIPVPSLREQERIVHRLAVIKEQVGALRGRVGRRAALADSILPSFLERATSGADDV